MTYCRANPSPRYTELLGFYRDMHESGEGMHAAHETFDGRSLAPHIEAIRSLVGHFSARTLLDYGSGKAKFYTRKKFTRPDLAEPVDLPTYWGIEHIHLYDPGFAPLASLPDQPLDCVICTDVMEHIPEEDIDWVIDELFAYARRFVYVCIATYPAGKRLPDGRNAHVTLMHPRWWVQRFEARRAARPDAPHFFLVIQRSPDDPKPAAITSF